MLLIKERRKACNDKKMKEEGVKIENKEAAGAFYFLEKAKDSVEVEKYIEDNILWRREKIPDRREHREKCYDNWSG